MSEEKKDHLLMVIGGKIAKWSWVAGCGLIIYTVISYFFTSFTPEHFWTFIEALKNPMVSAWFLMLCGPLIGLIIWGIGNDLQRKRKKKQAELESKD